MKIYIDNECKCHVTNDGTMREVETDIFDGKCTEYIEGYKYNDSNGLAVYPWKPYSQLMLAQAAADRVQAEADEQIMELLDVIEELAMGV